MNENNTDLVDQEKDENMENLAKIEPNQESNQIEAVHQFDDLDSSQ